MNGRTISSSYDITVEKKKVSGSAYKIANNSAYHHGTMLIDTNLARLQQFLLPLQVALVYLGCSDWWWY